MLKCWNIIKRRPSNFFFIAPLSLSKNPYNMVDTSALPELPIFCYIYLSLSAVIYQFWNKCWSADNFPPFREILKKKHSNILRFSYIQMYDFIILLFFILFVYYYTWLIIPPPFNFLFFQLKHLGEFLNYLETFKL